MFFFKVPGRLGMLVTIVLIMTNIYNNVQAPMNRDISYIEIWMMISLTPILIAIVEYGIILTMKKYQAPKIVDMKSKWALKQQDMKNFEDWSKTIDLFAVLLSITMILLGNLIYWTIVYSL